MLSNTGVDCISLLSKAVATFKIKKKTNKQTTIHILAYEQAEILEPPTLNPAFSPPNYLALASAALCVYWKRSNLE